MLRGTGGFPSHVENSISLLDTVDVTHSNKLPYYPGIAVNGQDLVSSY